MYRRVRISNWLNGFREAGGDYHAVWIPCALPYGLLVRVGLYGRETADGLRKLGPPALLLAKDDRLEIFVETGVNDIDMEHRKLLDLIGAPDGADEPPVLDES